MKMFGIVKHFHFSIVTVYLGYHTMPPRWHYSTGITRKYEWKEWIRKKKTRSSRSSAIPAFGCWLSWISISSNLPLPSHQDFFLLNATLFFFLFLFLSSCLLSSLQHINKHIKIILHIPKISCLTLISIITVFFIPFAVYFLIVSRNLQRKKQRT